MEEQKPPKIFRMQPILCPWIASQPYHSSLLNKNKPPSEQNDRFLNNPWNNRQMLGTPRSQDRLPSIQQSSSQFFYFLRLMQLFPDTHPATLHTVLMLCKNDFFCAVDKLLFAKRCKLLCQKKNLLQRNCQSRCHRRNSSETVVGNNNQNHCKSKGGKVVLQNKVQSDSEKKNEDPVAENCCFSNISDDSSVNVMTEKPEDLSTMKNCAAQDDEKTSVIL